MPPDQRLLQSPYACIASGEVSPVDPKPRLRWTPELHERFVEAVSQLGGADSKSAHNLFSLTNAQRINHGFSNSSVEGPSFPLVERDSELMMFPFRGPCVLIRIQK